MITRKKAQRVVAQWLDECASQDAGWAYLSAVATVIKRLPEEDARIGLMQTIIDAGCFCDIHSSFPYMEGLDPNDGLNFFLGRSFAEVAHEQDINLQFTFVTDVPMSPQGISYADFVDELEEALKTPSTAVNS